MLDGCDTTYGSTVVSKMIPKVFKEDVENQIGYLLTDQQFKLIEAGLVEANSKIAWEFYKKSLENRFLGIGNELD